jgi:hypothetical protein
MPQTELSIAREDVIEAARCIRHWHDTGRNDEGMVVSSKAVRRLWAALARYDAELAKTKKKRAA